jgi:hypothetical protein
MNGSAQTTDGRLQTTEHFERVLGLDDVVMMWRWVCGEMVGGECDVSEAGCKWRLKGFGGDHRFRTWRESKSRKKYTVHSRRKQREADVERATGMV